MNEGPDYAYPEEVPMQVMVVHHTPTLTRASVTNKF